MMLRTCTALRCRSVPGAATAAQTTSSTMHRKVNRYVWWTRSEERTVWQRDPLAQGRSCRAKPTSARACAPAEERGPRHATKKVPKASVQRPARVRVSTATPVERATAPSTALARLPAWLCVELAWRSAERAQFARVRLPEGTLCECADWCNVRRLGFLGVDCSSCACCPAGRVHAGGCFAGAAGLDKAVEGLGDGPMTPGARARSGESSLHGARAPWPCAFVRGCQAPVPAASPHTLYQKPGMQQGRATRVLSFCMLRHRAKASTP